MSGYTLGEIIVWLVLAALLGGVLGWLLRTLKCRSEHGSETLDRTEKGSGSLDRKENNVAPSQPEASTDASPLADATSGASTSAASVNGGSTSASSFANVEGSSQNAEPEKAGAVQVDDQAASATATGSFEPDKHPNSAKPLAGGAAPGPEWVVKGNADSMIYHVPGGRSYGATVAETWFRTAEDAQAAGFRAPKR